MPILTPDGEIIILSVMSVGSIIQVSCKVGPTIGPNKSPSPHGAPGRHMGNQWGAVTHMDAPLGFRKQLLVAISQGKFLTRRIQKLVETKQQQRGAEPPGGHRGGGGRGGSYVNSTARLLRAS